MNNSKRVTTEISLSSTTSDGNSGGAVWRRPLFQMITGSLLHLSSSIVRFGNVPIGQFKDTLITFSNYGNATLGISLINTTRSTFTARSYMAHIEPGKSLMDTIRYSPSVLGADSASIIITSTSMNSPTTIKVAGNAIPLTSVKEKKGIPSTFGLDQNFPNPSNPTTTINYTIPTRSHITLSVFNTLGQKVAELVNGEKDAGAYEVTFDASALASGVYLYRIEAGSFVQTKKLVVVK
jgi:hypothetical protein